MRRIIDLEINLPRSEEEPGYWDAMQGRPGNAVADQLPRPDGYGFDNYKHIFKGRPLSPEATAAAPPPPPEDDGGITRFIADMDKAGIELGVLGSSNATLARLCTAYPDRFIGLSATSPLDGMTGVRNFERLVREHNIGGLRVVALYNGIPASDRRYYPLYAKCVELDVPVRVYTAMTYANDRPYDIGHPGHLDQVCMDFPELRVVAGLAGWPWVTDMVALLRRHPNLYCDTAAHRPRHFATPGAGWESFLQFGNTLLQDKIMIGLSRSTFNTSFETLIAEYEALPLKPAVLDKWFHRNALTFLRRG